MYNTGVEKGCIFCKIITKAIPSKKVLETDSVYVFHDIRPSSQYHVLIVPKKHIKNIETVTQKDMNVLLDMTRAAQKIIKSKKPKKYKLVFNGGEYLEVDHLHWHLMIGNPK